MWLLPWLTWLMIAAILPVLGYILASEAYRYQASMTAGVTVFTLLVCFTRQR